MAMFEGGGDPSKVRRQIDAINTRYNELFKNKNCYQIVDLNEKRLEEIRKIEPRYGRSGVVE